MIELNKENICMGERSVAVFSQAHCETDIIVPDVNPDIAKVLQVSANTSVLNKTCGSNRITVDARADITILYLGDDGSIYNISSSQQVTHIIDAAGVSDGMYAETEINADNIDYTVLNTRKMNVKVLMGIDANASADVTATVCTGIESDGGYEILNENLVPYKTVGRISDQICVKERLEIPNGSPSADRILRMDAYLHDKNCTLTQNKLMIQATLCVSAVYLSDIDGKICTAEFEVPLTEVVAMPDVDETMKPCVKLCVGKIYYRPEQDEDGDNRFIMMECMIGVNAKASYNYNLNIVRDAYCVKHPVTITRESASVNRLVAESKSQISSKDVVVLSDDMPEISRIFNITPHAFLGTAKIEDGKAVIEGVIESDIMYISGDETGPISTYRHQQQFSHSAELSQTGENMVCDVRLDIVHSSYTISMGREIDLRFVLEVDLDVIADEKVEYVTDISPADEECVCTKSYCIKIYFVKEGDSLWSIAKKYRISKNSLMEINNINADSEIYDGRQIMIPIL